MVLFPTELCCHNDCVRHRSFLFETVPRTIHHEAFLMYRPRPRRDNDLTRVLLRIRRVLVET